MPETVLCLLLCPPLGLIAWLFTRLARARLAAGDIAAAGPAAVSAKITANAGFFIGLTGICLLVMKALR